MPPKALTEYYWSQAINRRAQYTKEACKDARAMALKIQKELEDYVEKYKGTNIGEKEAIQNAKTNIIGFTVWVVSSAENSRVCDFVPHFWVSGDSPCSKDNLRPIPASCTKIFLSSDKKLPKKMRWNEFVDDCDSEKKNRGKVFGKRLHVDIPMVKATSPALQAIREAGHPTVPRFDPLSATIVPPNTEGDEFDEDVMIPLSNAAVPPHKSKAKPKPQVDEFDEDVMDIDIPVTPKPIAKKTKASSAKKSPPEDEPGQNGSAKKSKKRKADDITPTSSESYYISPDLVKTILQGHPVISSDIQPMLSHKHNQENLKKFATSEALVTETLSVLMNYFHGKPEAKFVGPAVLFRIIATAMMPIVNVVEGKIYQYMDQKSIRPLITSQDKQVSFIKQKDTIQFIKNVVHHIRMVYDTCSGILSTYAKFESMSPTGIVAIRQSKAEVSVNATKTSLRIKELCLAMTNINYFRIINPPKATKQEDGKEAMTPEVEFISELVSAAKPASMVTDTPLVANSNAVTMMLFSESKDKKSELTIKTFGMERVFKLGDATSNNPSAYTIPTILFYGHPDSLSSAPETPKKLKKTKEATDAGHKGELPPNPKDIETVQQQKKPSNALALLKSAKRAKTGHQHGNMEIVKATAMQEGKWYHVSSDTMRALGYTKESDELFVTITPVLQSFFKFIEKEGKRADVSSWVEDVGGEDAGDSDAVFEMAFSDADSSSTFELNLLQYSILKDCVVSKLPSDVKAEKASVHLNASSRTLKIMLGKVEAPVEKMKDLSSFKKRGVMYLKNEDSIKKATDVDAQNLIIWLCVGASIFGIATGSKGSASEALVSQWNKFISLLPGPDGANNTE